MTEKEQKNNFITLFNQEQGTFSYYTCGLLIAMIAYSFNLIIETNKPYIYLPIIAIFTMFVSLYFGLYFIKYRLSNYYNNANILDIKEKHNEEHITKICKKMIETNSKRQSIWHKLHLKTIYIGPIIMFIWLVIISIFK